MPEDDITTVSTGLFTRFIYVTGEMDISAGTVSANPNFIALVSGPCLSKKYYHAIVHVVEKKTLN